MTKQHKIELYYKNIGSVLTPTQRINANKLY